MCIEHEPLGRPEKQYQIPCRSALMWDGGPRTSALATVGRQEIVTEALSRLQQILHNKIVQRTRAFRYTLA